MARRGLDFVELVSNGQVLQLILFACPDGVIVANSDDEVVLYTGAAERLFGFAPVDVMHRPLGRIFEDERAYAAFRRDMCRDGTIVSRELTATTADASTFSASVSGATLRERDGSALGAIFYVRDYSRMHDPQRALRDRNRELRAQVSRAGEAEDHDRLVEAFDRRGDAA